VGRREVDEIDIHRSDDPSEEIRISVCNEFLVGVNIFVERNSCESPINARTKDHGNDKLTKSRNIQRWVQNIKKQPMPTSLA
jgi:hypothetical protein